MQKTSLNLLKKKLKRYPHLNELERFLDKIKKSNPEFILLFGSLARGDYTQYSDIDVLCVFNQKFKSLKERFFKSYEHSDGLVQTKTLNLEEFENGIKNGNSFLLRIIDDGLILYTKIPEKVLIEWIKEGKKALKISYFAPEM